MKINELVKFIQLLHCTFSFLLLIYEHSIVIKTQIIMKSVIRNNKILDIHAKIFTKYFIVVFIAMHEMIFYPICRKTNET